MRTSGIICAASLVAILLAGGAAAWRSATTAGLASAAAVSGESRSPEDRTIELPVQVETDRTRYLPGDVIAVTLTNRHSETIYAPPPAPELCSVVSLDRLRDGGWVRQGGCNGSGVPLVSLAPATVMQAPLIVGADETRDRGTIIGDPTEPASLNGEAGSPPSSERPQPVLLTPQVPEGIINLRGLLYPAVDGPLPSDTYRVVLVFAVGAPGGPVETVYSQPFHVGGG